MSSNFDTDDEAGSKQRIARVIQLQRDTQFENMLLLEGYARAAPCGRTLFMPLEVFTQQPDVATGALTAAMGSLLNNPQQLIDSATTSIDAGMLHSQAHHSKARQRRRRLRANGPTTNATEAAMLRQADEKAQASKRAEAAKRAANNKSKSARDQFNAQSNELLSTQTAVELDKFYLKFRWVSGCVDSAAPPFSTPSMLHPA